MLESRSDWGVATSLGRGRLWPVLQGEHRSAALVAAATEHQENQIAFRIIDHCAILSGPQGWIGYGRLTPSIVRRRVLPQSRAVGEKHIAPWQIDRFAHGWRRASCGLAVLPLSGLDVEDP